MNIFEEARNFAGNDKLKKAIKQFRQKRTNEANLEIIKALISNEFVGILPVIISSGPFVNEDIEEAYSTGLPGCTLKICDYFSPNGQYVVIYTDYETAMSASNGMYKKCLWITTSGIDLINLCNSVDNWGLIINPFSEAVVLKNYYSNGMVGIPKFSYEEP